MDPHAHALSNLNAFRVVYHHGHLETSRSISTIVVPSVSYGFAALKVGSSFTWYGGIHHSDTCLDVYTCWRTQKYLLRIIHMNMCVIEHRRGVGECDVTE